jgi:VanZ family protein
MNQKMFSNNSLFCFLVWLPTVAYCGLIFYLSSQEISIKVSLFAMQDKAIHFMEYGVLSVLFFISLRKSAPGYNIKAAAVVAIIFSGFYGISDEVHQYFVPGRESSIGDVTANFIGAVVFQSIHILKLKLGF